MLEDWSVGGFKDWSVGGLECCNVQGLHCWSIRGLDHWSVRMLLEGCSVRIFGVWDDGSVRRLEDCRTGVVDN